MRNDPILHNDPLGDTVRPKGWTHGEILGWMNKGLKTDAKTNPFYFNKKGDLQYHRKLFDKLSDKQKEIATNMIGDINSKRVFTVEKVSGDYIINPQMPTIVYNGKDYPHKYHIGDKLLDQVTLRDIGGAITEEAKDGSGNVSIKIMQEDNQDVSLSPVNSQGQPIDNPKWMVYFHEVGGHGYCEYVCGNRDKPGFAVDYENVIRAFLGMDIRDYDQPHPTPHKN